MAIKSAYETGCVVSLSTAFLIFSIEAIAFFKPLFSGRSNSNRTEPFKPYFFPTTECVPASANANRQYDPKSKSMLSSIIGAMYCAYSICAFDLFAPDVLAAPSNRSSGSTSNFGKFTALFALIAFISSFADMSFSFKRSSAREPKSKARADCAAEVPMTVIASNALRLFTEPLLLSTFASSSSSDFTEAALALRFDRTQTEDDENRFLLLLIIKRC
mmetsp:Transcript_3976/g.14035  ORF Transcript_3976/g.14035 Transcript_3976/m.14035 type:complete len:217 (-) Transcript_3976:99-749(-)